MSTCIVAEFHFAELQPSKFPFPSNVSFFYIMFQPIETLIRVNIWKFLLIFNGVWIF